MKYTLIVPIAAALILGGCASSEEKAPKEENALKFESTGMCKTFVLEDTSAEFRRDNDLIFRDSASLIMPEVLYGRDIQDLRIHILREAFDTVGASVSETMEIFLTASADELGYQTKELPDSVGAVEADGFIYVEGAILNLTPRRLTYSISTETYYPGAAHGMHTQTFITYDLADAKIITLHDLFTAEGLNNLPGLISRKARRMAQQLGPTNITALPSEDNFYVTLDDEIVFVYQPYEVASYAQGAIMVPFYPYELSDWLTEEGLEFFGLNG